MSIDTSQFFQIFFEESEELLQQLEALLLELNTEAPEPDALHAIFRIAHSIKGNAGTFGFSELIEITHVMETLLDEMRHGRKKPTTEHRQVMLEAKDVLQMQLRALQHGTEVDPSRVLNVRQALESFATHDTPPRPKPPASAEKHGNLPPLPVTETEISPDNEKEQGYGFFVPLATIRKETGAANNGSTSATSTGREEHKREELNSPNASFHQHTESASLRVSVDKVDQLVNLVGELVITHAMIAARSQNLDPIQHQKLLSGISQLARNTRELQESVMSVRMVPMDFVFSRFPRLVHELSTKLGKKVNFVTDGGATELDKGMVEKIVDPLTHLVRNSLDHGLESPDIRRQRGKDETGTLRLSASHQGGHVVIAINDDGAGLNREKILTKAAEAGIDLPANASDEEVWQVIFRPGFSTADSVTDVSGRGVGMDVVRRNISSLGGMIGIDSLAGYGTRITISLPLTLAILDGITVRVGDELYILPLNYVTESFQPGEKNLRQISEHGMVIQVRGEYLPVVALHELFSLVPRSSKPSEGLLVVVQMEGHKAALWVDEVIGQQQVVVKNLEANYRKVPNISGATILGDGSVSLIIDVAHLLAQQRRGLGHLLDHHASL